MVANIGSSKTSQRTSMEKYSFGELNVEFKLDSLRAIREFIDPNKLSVNSKFQTGTKWFF